AARHFAAIVRSDPKDASARFGHGMSLVYLDQTDAGKGELIEAIRLNPAMARQVVEALQGMSENGKRDLAFALREEILKALKASGQAAILDEFTKNTAVLK
ncbi:MAG TPA: hypothetical protein PKH31_11135, partial [Candidatus Sumerlaeota bacterium]|nr:hypothetical protein [Candidatus Sumerlaeota bacterium]